jgi:hypothetical protein
MQKLGYYEYNGCQMCKVTTATYCVKLLLDETKYSDRVTLNNIGLLNDKIHARDTNFC